MPIHPILTEHSAVKAARVRLERLQSALAEAQSTYTAAWKRWQQEMDAALEKADPLPPQPSDPTVALKEQVWREQDAGQAREAEAVRKHEDDLRQSLLVREREIFAQVPELVAPLRALADELLALGHTAQRIDRLTGIQLSRAASHVIGLDEMTAAAAEGTSFLGMDINPPKPPAPIAGEPWVKISHGGHG